MLKRILIIVGHPDNNRERLNYALAESYRNAAMQAGHEVRALYIADMALQGVRSQAEFDQPSSAPAIIASQQDISWANHLVLIFPLWLGSMPGLLKIFLEQVFRGGFAFDTQSKKWPQRKLKGRSARIVVTMGMPALVYRWNFGAHGLKNLKRCILSLCGVKSVKSTLIGLVGATDRFQGEKWIRKMEVLGTRGI